MSTLQASLNLPGPARTLEGAKPPNDRQLANDPETSGELGLLGGHAAELETEDSAFVAAVQALLANGNVVPPPGQDLPLEAVDMISDRRGAPAGGLAPGAEALMSAAEQGRAGGDLTLASLGGKFELSPIAQALERLQGPKQMLAEIETGSISPVGRLADAGSVPLGSGVNPVGSLNPLAEASTLSRPTFSLDVPLGQQKWADALGERVGLMLQGDQQIARLRLDPPHLGPLELRVALNQDQASVAFVAQHAAVREALEQAIPRLRELLGQQDLQLVDVDVSQGELADGRGESEFAQESTSASLGGIEAAEGPDDTTAPKSEARLTPQLVDLFA